MIPFSLKVFSTELNYKNSIKIRYFFGLMHKVLNKNCSSSLRSLLFYLFRNEEYKLYLQMDTKFLLKKY
jgi:hypothetical protein